jgi:hypothetical protein
MRVTVDMTNRTVVRIGVMILLSLPGWMSERNLTRETAEMRPALSYR